MTRLGADLVTAFKCDLTVSLVTKAAINSVIPIHYKSSSDKPRCASATFPPTRHREVATAHRAQQRPRPRFAERRLETWPGRRGAQTLTGSRRAGPAAACAPTGGRWGRARLAREPLRAPSSGRESRAFGERGMAAVLWPLGRWLSATFHVSSLSNFSSLCLLF